MANSNIRLTKSQQTVLAMIKSAHNQNIVYSKIAQGMKKIAALELLNKQKIINITDDNQISITKTGEEVMLFNGLIDDNGDLTSDAKDLLQSKQTFLEFISEGV